MTLVYNSCAGDNQASNGSRCIRDKRKLILDTLYGAKQLPALNRAGKARINASGEGVLVEGPRRKRKSDGGLKWPPRDKETCLGGIIT